MYSLGVIAYEALTGRPPFDGHTLAEIVCMHLSRDPVPLQARCDAPPELCDLVSRMLRKAPWQRPTAAEVRHTARAIARELSQAYEEFEVTGVDTRARRGRACIVPSDDSDDEDVAVIDADELEYGVTEMLPVVRQPRWTPEIGHIPSVLTAQPQPRSTIAPRAPRDQVAGEINLDDKPR
jgi:serine/threonine protein kinase